MEPFKRLFGLPASSVQRTCVLMPFVRKIFLRPFGVEKLNRGCLYAAARGPCATVIHSLMGPAFTGDAVLYLEGTPCENIILFGACGLLGQPTGLKIGSLIVPPASFAQESFVELLAGNAEPGMPAEADPELAGALHSYIDAPPDAAARGISVGSLRLQERHKNLWTERGARVIDLESSAFFAAASMIGKRAAALLVVTDIVGEKPYWRRLGIRETAILGKAFVRASRLLCGFIKEKLRD